jgi:hypothetical protein
MMLWAIATDTMRLLNDPTLEVVSEQKNGHLITRWIRVSGGRCHMIVEME